MAANPSACVNFTTITDFLNDAVGGSQNVTETVDECPGICKLVWGSGNPDLSGIGAHISYLVQVALTVVFGPLFVAIYAYLYKSPKSRARQVSPRPPASSPGPVGTVTIHDRLVGLQQSFIDANAGFAIPVAVAAIVRIKQQHVPFYELAFLEPLLTMQFLSLLSISLAHAVVGSKGSARSPARVTVMVVCCLAEFALYMGLVGSLRTSETTWAAIQELGSACSSYGAVLPGFEYFEGQLPTDAVPDLPSPFPQFLNTEGWKKGLAIFGLSLAGIAGLAVLAAIVLVLGLLIVEEREPVTVGLLSLGLSIGSLYCAVQMSRKRDAMRIISGGEFQDNEWGFGQVIAIFLWVPLLLHALNLTITFSRLPIGDHQVQEESGQPTGEPSASSETPETVPTTHQANNDVEVVNAETRPENEKSSAAVTVDAPAGTRASTSKFAALAQRIRALASI